MYTVASIKSNEMGSFMSFCIYLFVFVCHGKRLTFVLLSLCLPGMPSLTLLCVLWGTCTWHIFFSIFLVGVFVVIHGSLKLFRQSMDIVFAIVFNHNVNGNININVFVPNVVTFGTCV